MKRFIEVDINPSWAAGKYHFCVEKIKAHIVGSDEVLIVPCAHLAIKNIDGKWYCPKHPKTTSK